METGGPGDLALQCPRLAVLRIADSDQPNPQDNLNPPPSLRALGGFEPMAGIVLRAQPQGIIDGSPI